MTRTVISLALDPATPPSEFRLFVSGMNATTKGEFLFDAEAATSVMRAFEEHGVDLAIDLEHQALAADAPVDPTARDARGWFRLEVRKDGSLWAVGVKWTADGAARLAERRQRYISPAFEVDASGRITRVINAAITAMPATHNTPALVAASERNGGTKTMGTLKDLEDLLKAGKTEEALALVKEMLAVATSFVPLSAEAAKQQANTRIMASTHTTSMALAADVVEELTRRRDAYEANERRQLCARLVVEGGRPPAAVWADDTATLAKPYLRALSLEQLRQHVEEEIRTVPAGLRTAPKPPALGREKEDGGQEVSTTRGPLLLSRREVDMCKELKVDLQAYAEEKVSRAAAAGGGR